jgi:hypothetical protein
MSFTNNKKSITISKISGEQFLENPQTFLDLLVGDQNVGRLTITSYEGVFYLMTEEKFHFFIDYELKKQHNLLSKEFGTAKPPKEEIVEEEQPKPKPTSYKPQNYKTMLDLKKRLNLFPNFTDQEFLTIFRDVVVSKYKKGDNIYYKDEPDHELFYIFRGEVALSNYNEKTLVLGKNEFFGELAFIGSGEKQTYAKVFSEMTIVVSFLLKPLITTGDEALIMMKLYKELSVTIDNKVKKLLKLNR